MTSPIVTTSRRPSPGTASGHIFMPPPKKRPFATTTSNIRPLRASPSTVSRVSTADHPAKTANVAQRYEAFAPSAFEVSLARCAIAPLMPGARDVGEERRPVGAVPAPVAHPAEVDRLRLAGQRHPRRRRDVVRDPERADEVAARAAGDERDRRRVLDAGETVDDLVDRAVAADDDEQARAVERRLARELAEVPAPLAKQRVALEPRRPRPGERSRASGDRSTRLPRPD